ncbi:MAG: hypothetical protein L0J41_00145 [Alkalibacterium sp.]|uniref:hypothetical protein n=1 Tax=Alkalibacterium TaxID=99906 RepID=UPI0026488759|nr:hypothetical protein [Alkalibacterium sp.]MDN6294767.1 hypothetical protein [Alkalibacterium sp.]MDN6397602.1 hypothetical protein [Alkalibacterium sp.]
MKLIMYGMNQTTVSKDVLHKYRLDYSMREQHLKDISNFKGVSEVMLVATEKRNEYYLYIDETIFNHGDLLRYLSVHTGRSLENIILETYSKFNSDVVTHLFRLTSVVNEYSEPLSVLEQSLYEGKLLKTTGEILENLFNRSISFSLSLYDKKALYPLLNSYEAKMIQSMDLNLPVKEDLDFLIIGSHQILKHLSTYLVGKTNAYLTFLEKNEKSKKMIASLRRSLVLTNKLQKINTIQTADLNQLVYRLSKSDVIIIGPSVKNAWLSNELLEDMHEMRPSTKNQLILDLCGSQDETLFFDYPEMNYIQIPESKGNDYSSEKVKVASTFYEDYVTNESNAFMDTFNQKSKEKRDSAPLKKTFKRNYRYENLNGFKV